MMANDNLAHRTLIARKLKGLEDVISFTALHWYFEPKKEPGGNQGEGGIAALNRVIDSEGWRFVRPDESLPGEHVEPDPLHKDFTQLRQIYFQSDPEYKARFSVPVLYDRKTSRIVNNEVRASNRQ